MTSLDRTESGSVLVSITRVLGDGSVEATLLDAAGEVWTFVGDATVFGASRPGAGSLRCSIVRDEMVDGILLVHIEAAVASVDGMTRFRVLRAMVP